MLNLIQSAVASGEEGELAGEEGVYNVLEAQGRRLEVEELALVPQEQGKHLKQLVELPHHHNDV
jgi:hypothetical protein